jgi:hypothetical protein
MALQEAEAVASELRPLCGTFSATDGSGLVFDIPHQTADEMFTIGRGLHCNQPLLGNSAISEHFLISLPLLRSISFITGRTHCGVHGVLSEDRRSLSTFVKDISKNGTYVCVFSRWKEH